MKTVLTMCIVLLAAPALAQGTPSMQPAKPSSIALPSQLASAKTVFLGFAGAHIQPKPGIEGVTYASMYSALLGLNRFQIVAAPTEAELSMEISVGADVESGTFAATGNPFIVVRLAVFDTKTHARLWTFDEFLQGAFRQSTYLKNIDDATARLAEDFNAVANGNLEFLQGKMRYGQEPKPPQGKARATQVQKPTQGKTRYAQE